MCQFSSFSLFSTRDNCPCACSFLFFSFGAPFRLSECSIKKRDTSLIKEVPLLTIFLVLRKSSIRFQRST